MAPTREQMPAVIHEPDSIFPRLPSHTFTDAEFEAEYRRIQAELKAQGKPLFVPRGEQIAARFKAVEGVRVAMVEQRREVGYCMVCGVEFDVKAAWHHYCSKRCRDKGTKAGLSVRMLTRSER